MRITSSSLFVLAGFLSACTDAGEQLLGDFAAPAGDYHLRVTHSSGWLPRSPFILRLYLLPRGETQPTRVVETEMANTGAPFSADHIALKWVAARTVLLCVKPPTAPTHGLRVELSDQPQVEQVARC